MYEVRCVGVLDCAAGRVVELAGFCICEIICCKSGGRRTECDGSEGCEGDFLIMWILLSGIADKMTSIELGQNFVLTNNYDLKRIMSQEKSIFSLKILSRQYAHIKEALINSAPPS